MDKLVSDGGGVFDRWGAFGSRVGVEMVWRIEIGDGHCITEGWDLCKHIPVKAWHSGQYQWERKFRSRKTGPAETE